MSAPSLRSLCRRAEALRRLARALRAAAIAAGGASVAGVLAVIGLRALGREWPTVLAAALPLLGAVAGSVWSLVYQSRSLSDAALALEERYGLKTLLTTALTLESTATVGAPASGTSGAFVDSIIADAENNARRLSPGSIVEWRLGRPGLLALIGPALLVLATFTFPELDLFHRKEALAVENVERTLRREEARRLEDLARRLDAPPAERPLGAASEQDIAGELDRLADSLRDPRLGREEAMLRVSDLEQKVKAEREALAAKEPELNAMALKNLKTAEARSLALSIMNRDYAGASAQASSLAEALQSGAFSAERQEALGADLKQLAEATGGESELSESLGSAGESLEAALPRAGAEHLEDLAQSLRDLARSAEAERALAAASGALDRTRAALGDASGSGTGEAAGEGGAGEAGQGEGDGGEASGSAGRGDAGSDTQSGAGAASGEAGSGANGSQGQGQAGSEAGQSAGGQPGGASASGSQGAGETSRASGGASDGTSGGTSGGDSGNSGQSGAQGASGASGQQGGQAGGATGQQPGGQSGSQAGAQAGSSGSSPQGAQPGPSGSNPGQGQGQQQGGGWGQTPPSDASAGDGGGQQGGGQQGGPQPGGGQAGSSGGQSAGMGGGAGSSQSGQSGSGGSSGGGQSGGGSASGAGGTAGGGSGGGDTDWGVGSTNLEQGGGGAAASASGDKGSRQSDGSKAAWEEKFMSLYRERSIQARTQDGQVQGQHGQGEELGWRSVDGQVERREPTAAQGDLFMETRIREKQSLDQQDIPFEYKDSVRRYFDSIEVPNR